MSGVTAAFLNLDGKMPSENDRFASLVINSEKTPDRPLRVKMVYSLLRMFYQVVMK